MANILDTIVERKKEEVAELKRNGIVLPEGFQGIGIEGPRGFRDALVNYDGVSVIAEVKKASPSKGVICKDFNPVDIAVNYQKSGAQAISVLTDIDFFQGDLLYLMQVREAVKLPAIRKDFIIDELQIKEAAAHGADAILLIAAILDVKQLKDYQDYAAEFGMDCLVEVHDEIETEMALEAESNLIGVNNRNLKTFEVDINTTFAIRKLVPAEIPLVSESGLKSREDIIALEKENISAALIGETLMRLGTGGDVLAGLRG